MVKLTMIARVTDGLPLAEGLDDAREVQEAEQYKQQVKSLFKNLSTGQNEPSRMSIETGPYIFQYPFLLSEDSLPFFLLALAVSSIMFYTVFKPLIPFSTAMRACCIMLLHLSFKFSFEE